MLQIASGKLFAHEPGQRNKLRGILYTNLQLHGRDSVETSAGRILPTTDLRGTQNLVYELTELIEEKPTAGGLVSHGIEPYLSDFAAIVSFALNVTCTPNPNLTLRLTSGIPSALTGVSQEGLVRRVFDRQIWCQEEDITKLVKFVHDLIGLRRKPFLAAMKAIRTYVVGLHRMADDLEVAYTLLVATVESLAQRFDGYTAVWADYEEGKRHKIDEALTNADAETGRLVRQALLEIEHISLRRRFCNFTLEHLTPSFFREEASGLGYPVGRSDLKAALPQVYTLRSKYLHSLEQLPPLLTVPLSHREAIRIDGRILLTFQGLTRLARHVITGFIERQPKVDTEVYDYSREQAGILHLPTAPQYWIWQTDGLTAFSGRRRLEGFLQQIASHLQQETEQPVTDIRDMLGRVEDMLPGMSTSQRTPFLALYLLFNKLVLRDKPLERFQEIQERYGSEITTPSVEAIVVHLLLGTVPNWSLAEHRQLHDAYFRDKWKRNSLHLPPTLEAGMTLDLAERYRAKGGVNYARELVGSAVENHPGHADLYRLEQGFDPREPIDWRNVVLPGRTDATDDGNDV